jgi:hypothetical protein
MEDKRREGGKYLLFPHALLMKIDTLPQDYKKAEAMKIPKEYSYFFSSGR